MCCRVGESGVQWRQLMKTGVAGLLPLRHSGPKGHLDGHGTNDSASVPKSFKEISWHSEVTSNIRWTQSTG